MILLSIGKNVQSADASSQDILFSIQKTLVKMAFIANAENVEVERKNKWQRKKLVQSAAAA